MPCKYLITTLVQNEVTQLYMVTADKLHETMINERTLHEYSIFFKCTIYYLHVIKMFITTYNLWKLM